MPVNEGLTLKTSAGLLTTFSILFINVQLISSSIPGFHVTLRQHKIPIADPTFLTPEMDTAGSCNSGEVAVTKNFNISQIKESFIWGGHVG